MTTFRVFAAGVAIVALSATESFAVRVAYQGFDNMPNVATLLINAGHTPGAMTPTDIEEGDLLTGDWDVFVMSRNSVVCDGPQSAYSNAVLAYVLAGGNVVTEWNAGPMFFTSDDPSVYCEGSKRLAIFDGIVHAGNDAGTNTPIDLLAPSHPLFAGIPDPMTDGGGTEHMFWIENPDPRLTTLGRITGTGGAFPVGQNLPVVLEGCHGGSRFVFGLHDWNDTLASLSPADSQNFLINSVEYAAEGCNPCPDTPSNGCLAGLSASLQIKDDEDAARDSLKWKLKQGGAFDQAWLGDPVTTRTWALCVYDEVGGVPVRKASAVVAPGPFWVDKDPAGFKYNDKTGLNDGITKIGLKPGTEGRSSAQVMAKGVNLSLPAPISDVEFFDQDSQVIVQLVNDQNAECLSSEFTLFRTNSGTAFKASAP